MKTSKPFSTITWNNEGFLKSKLERLVQKRVIYAWAFIRHLKEEDETKDHYHVIFFPNGKTDTEQVLKELEEMAFDEDGALAPIRPLPPKPSKFADWFLYCKHDTAYLLTKDQTRKYHYTDKDFHVSNQDFFIEEIHQIDMSKYKRQADIARRILEDGVTPSELVASGSINIAQYNAWSKFYDLTAGTYRNGRITHSPKKKDDNPF